MSEIFHQLWSPFFGGKIKEREARFAEIQKVAERGNRLILRPKTKPAQTPTPPPAVL